MRSAFGLAPTPMIQPQAAPRLTPANDNDVGAWAHLARFGISAEARDVARRIALNTLSLAAVSAFVIAICGALGWPL